MADSDTTQVSGRTSPGHIPSSEIVLSVLAGPDLGRLVSARGAGAALRVGRGEDNDLVLHDEAVSRHHTMIEVVGGRLILRDLDSKNGTIVNRVHIRECELRSGDVVQIGGSAVRVSYREEVPELVPAAGDRLEEMWSRNPRMHEVFALIRRIAPSPLPVLIQGETGTGKELVARALHRLSPRTSRPFVAVNCAALPRELIESELFGHERGAFTGATGLRKGAFEQAASGTLFLDEIGELGLDLQPRLLRAVETGAFRRVGGTDEVSVAVRVVAATNRDLAREVGAGHFRQDLYYRLFGLSVTLPPLRERPEDIVFLADVFLAAHGSASCLAPEALERLTAHSWPGNVRELRLAIERALAVASGPVLDGAAFALLANGPVDASAGPSATRSATGGDHAEPLSLADAERVAIQRALTAHAGNKRAAANALGIAYSTLFEKLRKYGLHV
jgi:DNA-binding NtrC family response regulator